MTYESRLPTGRPDVELSSEQETACRRAERGLMLSDGQRGMLRAAVVYASREHADRVEVALAADWDRRRGGGRA